jgi:hypothetical protein
MSVDICYIVTHGFSARMVLQSEVIPNLRKEGKSVVVIAPNASEESMKRHEKEYGIKVIQSPVKGTWLMNEYFFLKRYLYEDIRNNPALWEKHLRETKDNKSKHPWRVVRPRLYYFLHKTFFRLAFIRKLLKATERLFLYDKKLQSLLREINPKVLICTYPSNLQESIYLNEARALNIKTVIHLLSWDNISCKGHFSAIGDYFISWGQIMSDEFVEYYQFNKDRIYETGVAHFDKHHNVVSAANINQYVSALGIDVKRPYLLFGMSSPYFAPYEIEVVEHIAAKIERGEYGDGVQFIVRPHPQNVQGNLADLSWLPRLQKLKSKNVAVDIPIIEQSKLAWNMNQEDIVKLVNLVAGASVVLNSGSTFSIDALMHEIPVILTPFDSDKSMPWHMSTRRIIEYTHLNKLIKTEGITPVKNYMELDEWITKYLNNKDLFAAERRRAKIAECGENDGKASLRISEAIIDILKR